MGRGADCSVFQISIRDEILSPISRFRDRRVIGTHVAFGLVWVEVIKRAGVFHQLGVDVLVLDNIVSFPVFLPRYVLCLVV